MLKNIIIEGVDRLGKDTLIKGIQDRLGFFQEIHYQKPKALEIHYKAAIKKIVESDSSAVMDPQGLDYDANQQALKAYQQASFYQMFLMLSQPGRYLLNRAHLGEAVYAPMYRKYDGSYVFDLERHFTNDLGSSFTETTLLVLLTTSNFSFVQDDGLSFDFNKKDEEQDNFKKAFNRSTIKNKIIVDVAQKVSRHGVTFWAYRKREDVLKQVIDEFSR